MTEVLVVTADFDVGGIKQVVSNIILGLDENKFKVYLYVLKKIEKVEAEIIQRRNIEIIDNFSEIRKTSSQNKRILLYRCVSDFMDKHPGINAIHVHCYNESPEILLAAHKHKIPVICMHSHAAYSKYWNPHVLSWKTRIAAPVFRLTNNLIPTHKIGCSLAACQSAFGKTKGTLYIPNGIDMEKFSKERLPEKKILREKYGFSKEKKILIFVGRFSPQKNPIFMIRVFNELLGMDKRYRLVLVGYGELEESLKNEVTRLNLSETTKFYPPDSDVPELLKAADYFITPSLFEGLGIVFIEAQMMGLPAFASDQVPQEADLGMCEFIPLSSDVKGYADYIHEYITRGVHKEVDINKAKAFDMKEIIKIYEAIYAGEE